MKKIGKYEIIEQIGRGAMGVVYKAMDPFIERVVAVKTMSADLDADPELRSRFFREARSAGQLSHKNIVTIYELGEESGQAFIAMEFLDGEDIKARIIRGDRIPLEDRLGYMIQISEGLSHAHKKGVFHRDIKPGNIYVTSTGQVKILDFGLARIASSEMTKTGSVMGTPNYMSPEQIRGAQVDNRSDIFSAGATFYELLTFRKPFDGDSLQSTFFKILQEEPEPIARVVPAIPQEFSTVVLKAMAKEPMERYQNADELLQGLTRLEKVLDQHKRKTREEAGAAVKVLDNLIGQNAGTLAGEFRQAELDEFKTRILTPSSIRQDHDDEGPAEQTGYLEMVAIRDKAKHERERLEALLQIKQKTDLLLRQAADLEQKGQIEKALELVEKAVEELPQNVDALGAMARIQKLLADRAQTEARNAIDQLDQLIKQNAELLEGEEFASPGDLKAAILLTSIPARSTDQDATVRLGRDSSREEILKVRDRAAHEIERLTGVIEVRKRVAHRLQDALECERSGKLEDALALANDILGQIPEHSQAHELVDRVRETLAQRARQQEERRRLDGLVRQSRQLYSQKNLAGALKTLNEALAIDPQHSDALALHHQASADLEEEKRRQERNAEVESLLQQAPVRISAGDLPGARSSLARVLELEPNHSGASGLLADVERQLREQAEREEKRRMVEARVAAARKALEAGNLADARREIESALVIDPGEASAKELLARVARAEEALRVEAERKSRIAEKLAQARKLADTGELDRARELARSVLTEEKGNPEAAELLTRIEKLIAESVRQQRIRELLDRAEGLAQRKDYAAAASLLGKAEPDIASENSVTEALKRNLDAAQARKLEAEEIAKALSEAGKALGSGRLKEARELVDGVLSKAPDRAEAAQLLKQIDAADEKRKASEQAEERCRALLAQAAELASAGHHPEAIALLKTVKPPASLQQSVAQTIKQYQKENQAQEEARERRERMERGRKAFERSEYPACVSEMDQILGREPNNADALSLRKQADEALQKQREAEKRQKDLDEALRLAQQCIDKGDLKTARTHVSRAQTLSPEDQTAAGLSAQIAKNETALREEQKKQHRGRELAVEAQAALKKDDLDRAGVLLAEAVALGLDSSLAGAIKKDIEKAQDSRRQREEAEKEARTLLAQVQEFAARNEHAAAVAALERAKPAVAALPSVKQSLEQHRKAHKAQEEARERARRVQEHLERGKQLFKSQDYAGCAREMDQLLAQEPDHPEAVDLRRLAIEAVDKKRKEERRLKELADALGAARQSLAKGDLKAARGHVASARALERENAEATQLSAQIDKREAELREEQERKQRRQALVAQADSALAENDPARAEALLSEAAGLGLEPAAAASLQKRIDKLKKRSNAGSPKAAEVAAAPVTQKTGGSPAIWVVAAVALLGVVYLIWTFAFKGPQYQEQIAAAKSHIESQEFDKVAGELQPIPANSPLYAEAQGLIQQASEGLKRKNIEASLAAAQDLRKQGKNEESLAAAESVLALDSSNQAATTLRSEILRESFEEKTQADRKAFLASALESTESLFKSGDLQGALVKANDVLRLEPNNSAAISLKRRIENQTTASKNAAAEQARVTPAKTAAQNSNAPELVPARFTAAQRAEDSALADLKAGRFDQAAKAFANATALYGDADRTARAEAQSRADREREEQQAAATQALRGQADTARNAYEQNRSRAQNADAENKVRDRFQAAVGVASDAQARYRAGDFAAAKAGWENASSQMQSAQAEAAKVTPAPPPQTAANVPAAAPPPAPAPPRASAPSADDRTRLAAEAAQRETADRQAIRAALERYRTAYEARSLEQIKAVFPGIAGTEERSHVNNFDVARTIQMQLVERTIEISGETARGVYQQQIQMTTRDNRRVTAPQVPVTFNLQKRGGAWIIAGVNR